MNLLILIISDDFSKKWCNNIAVLKKYMEQITPNIDYAGICSIDAFHNYEDIISFQYKIINPKKQFSKICDFITEYKKELHLSSFKTPTEWAEERCTDCASLMRNGVKQYDWFIKIRPEVLLFEKIQFDQLSSQAINARSRMYFGPRQILYGSSIGGIDSKITNYCVYDTYEHDILLDDHIFIFHKNMIDKNAFDTFIADDEKPENEAYQCNIWKSRKIDFHVIGINMVMQKYNYYSGHIPPKRQRPNLKMIFA